MSLCSSRWGNGACKLHTELNLLLLGSEALSRALKLTTDFILKQWAFLQHDLWLRNAMYFTGSQASLAQQLNPLWARNGTRCKWRFRYANTKMSKFPLAKTKISRTTICSKKSMNSSVDLNICEHVLKFIIS